jgi:outer membrane protein TolC
MDEDQAQVQALAAQRDLARANARALVSWGRLMAGLGGLSVSSLEQADQALLKP